MTTLRPDLDGMRVIDPDVPGTWLMFDGKRHRIASASTLSALFIDPNEALQFYGVEEITRGPDLSEDACIARGEGQLALYLITTDEEGAVRRRQIATWDTFCAFGFDESKARSVPLLMIEGVHPGKDLLIDR